MDKKVSASWTKCFRLMAFSCCLLFMFQRRSTSSFNVKSSSRVLSIVWKILEESRNFQSRSMRRRTWGDFKWTAFLNAFSLWMAFIISRSCGVFLIIYCDYGNKSWQLTCYICYRAGAGSFSTSLLWFKTIFFNFLSCFNLKVSQSFFFIFSRNKCCQLTSTRVFECECVW